ncbi:MAG TPA: aldo/keto reductase, partial [Desulfobaccales bacterium]|nr:aldo/keto reductase [Desulfobaccales bacterium]
TVMNYFENKEENKTASRLVLGTAQLGMPYGIANSTGQPDFDTAVAIIKTAWECGIREFDTAQAYGESEAVLGKALSSLGIANDARIITKLDPKLDPRQGQDIKKAVHRSLERLQLSRLFGLMLHREEWLDDLDRGLESALQALVLDGSVQHLGVSLYTPAMALRALKSDIVDMIQVPANILDRRFADAGVVTLANEKRKQVYIRSVFLQGLLLMKPEDLPVNMGFAKATLSEIDNLCAQYKYSRQQLALLYIKCKYPQARTIVGAETLTQVEQNINIWINNHISTSEIKASDSWSVVDERIINPSLWS